MNSQEPNQSQEIYEYIKANPEACIVEIVEGTRWNRHLVEVATQIMVERNLIYETGKTDYNDPKFAIVRK